MGMFPYAPVIKFSLDHAHKTIIKPLELIIQYCVHSGSRRSYIGCEGVHKRSQYLQKCREEFSSLSKMRTYRQIKSDFSMFLIATKNIPNFSHLTLLTEDLRS